MECREIIGSNDQLLLYCACLCFTQTWNIVYYPSSIQDVIWGNKPGWEDVGCEDWRSEVSTSTASYSSLVAVTADLERTGWTLTASMAKVRNCLSQPCLQPSNNPHQLHDAKVDHVRGIDTLPYSSVVHLKSSKTMPMSWDPRMSDMICLMCWSNLPCMLCSSPTAAIFLAPCWLLVFYRLPCRVLPQLLFKAWQSLEGAYSKK